MPPKRLTTEEWTQIEAEWDAGILSLSEIARNYGLADHSSITKRASRKGWKARPDTSDIVRSLVPGDVTGDNDSSQAGTNTRIVLQAFDRVIKLLREHRKDLGYLHAAIRANLEGVEVIVNARLEKGGRMTLKERLMIGQILRDATTSMAKIIPLERRAFGLSDEEISEFDTFSNDQLEALENTVRKALGG